MGETTRIQFNVTQEQHDRLMKLKEKTGSGTLAEVLRNSLKLYETCIDLKGSAETPVKLVWEEDGKSKEGVLLI